MSEIIAITNQKGGVGKTTTSYNLASALSRYNKKILLIDLDPQGNCSLAIGIDSSISRKTVAELLLDQIDLKKAIRKTGFKNISIIPANLSLAMVESNRINQGKNAPTTLLKEKLNEKASSIFDFIIIDCPPSLGFLSLNGLSAADSIIIPVNCEYFALDALAQLLSSVSQVQRSTNPNLDVMGILLTMYDSRTKLSIDMAQEIRSQFRDKVFTTEIPRNVSIAEAICKGMPVNEYKPGSAGSLTYAALSREVMEFVEKKNRN
ncbi:MAG: ParA family protein [Bacilli bacterium]